MNRIVWISMLLFVLVACSSAQEAPEGDSGGTADEGKPAEPEKPVSKRGTLEAADSPEQKRAVDLIEKVTGKAFLKPVPVYVYTAEELEAEVAEWGDFAPDNVMGFYRFSTEALYIVPEVAGNRRAFGLRVHEARHAHQDQLYDLEALHAKATTTDANWAILGLVEGDAVQVMIDCLIDTNPHVAFIGKVKLPKDNPDPRAYRPVFNYAAGTRFIQHLKKDDGYNSVDEAFRNPPVSSEQIMHPEKYKTNPDLPDLVTFDNKAVKEVLPKGWSVGDTDTLGEFEMRLWFVTDEATIADSAELAAGWGGDTRLSLMNGEDEAASLWVTTWDTEADAQAVFDAVGNFENVRYSAILGRRVSMVLGKPGMESSVVDALAGATGSVKIEMDRK